MNRVQWQKFAKRWLKDARTLLNEHRWSAAYYIAGYAVECALKACVLGRLVTEPEVIFDIKKFSENCWTHNLFELVKLAGLEPRRAADIAANSVLHNHWLTLKDWSEKARYQTTSQQKAKKLYQAITDKTNGGMQWIRVHW